MDIQTMLNNAMVAGRAKEMKTSPQLTLGELILKLEAVNQNLFLYFDNEKYRPTGIDSWRGSYCELAISYDGNKGSYNSDEVVWKSKDGKYTSYKKIPNKLPKNLKVKHFVKMLKNIVGKTFTGYKGGDFLMGRQTPLWVANYGGSEGFRKNNNTAIIDVLEKKNKVIIKTKALEY